MKVSELIQIASKESGIGIAEIMGDCRSPHIAQVRFAVCLVARKSLGMSFSQIGRDIGKRDHSTVRSAVRRASLGYVNKPIMKKLKVLADQYAEEERLYDKRRYNLNGGRAA